MQLLKQIKHWSVVMALVAAAANAEEPRELSWNDLVPESETAGAGADARPQTQLDRLLAEVESNQSLSAPVVKELNGANVKIPGFIVPLEFADEGTVGSFLLVPYFGACMHYPPPPPNQVVFVTLDQPRLIESLWEPVWVSGEMTTEFRDSEMGSAGYSMTAEEIAIYE